MQLDLPVDQELGRWFRQRSFRLLRGVSSGAFLYRSRQRLSGRGERTGVVKVGRVEDLHLTESILANRFLFRRVLVPPRRRVVLIPDLQAADADEDTCRLLSLTALVGGAILHLSEASVMLAPVGTRRRIPPSALVGPGAFRLLRRTLEGLGRKPKPRTTTAAQLRMARSLDPGAHTILLTHYLESPLVKSVPVMTGATLVLVAPRHRLTGAGGWSAGWSALEPAGAEEEDIAERYRLLRMAAARAGLRFAVVPGVGRAWEACGSV